MSRGTTEVAKERDAKFCLNKLIQLTKECDRLGITKSDIFEMAFRKREMGTDIPLSAPKEA